MAVETNRSAVTGGVAGSHLIRPFCCTNLKFHKDLTFSQEDNTPYEKPDDDLCEKIVEQVGIETGTKYQLYIFNCIYLRCL